MREYTTKQRELVRRMIDTYGNDAIKHSAPDGRGWILVRAKCQAGEWQWRFDADGELKSSHLTERLFEMAPQPKVKARNALQL